MNPYRVDLLNTLLLATAALASFFFPFEVFLFAYAFFGPLHYLTEISWLEERAFFLSNKKFSWFLIAAGIAIFLVYLNIISFTTNAAQIFFVSTLIACAFLLAFLYIKPRTQKEIIVLSCITITLLILTYFIQSWAMFFALLLPTIIHVSVFTILFMFQGAQRSKSHVGYFNVFFYLILNGAIVLFTIDGQAYSISEYITNAYRSFEGINLEIMNLLNIGNPETQWSIYESVAGLSIMRFIAFAYTYHYLNWFSKVNIIKWYKVSKRILIFTLVIWVASIILYIANYRFGLFVLYFLSLMHVLLEFPLNQHSIASIWSGFKKNEQVTPPNATS